MRYCPDKGFYENRRSSLFFYGAKIIWRGARGAATAPVVAPRHGVQIPRRHRPRHTAPWKNPSGVNENDPAGVYEPGMKTGGDGVVLRQCLHRPNRCAGGGRVLRRAALPLPSGCPAHRTIRMPCAAPQGARLLQANGCPIRHSAMVWCQGLHRRRPAPQDVTKPTLGAFCTAFMQDAGAQTLLLIQIGNQRDGPELYLPMQQAQEKPPNRATSCWSAVNSKTFAAKGLMKDRFHYLQPAYNAS